MRKVDRETGVMTDTPFEFNVSDSPDKNQRHYEALGEVLNEHVYELLIEEGLTKIYIPGHSPQDRASFVFANRPNFKHSKKLLVLINGSGVVRAGQWSRRWLNPNSSVINKFNIRSLLYIYSLIINHSLDHGTQLPYIRRAMALGYDILVTNTNENYRHGAPLEGSQNAVAHGRLVWEQFIGGQDNASRVAIVAHSFGGVVTLDLANKFGKEFKEKVFAVGFTDSVHGSSPSAAAQILNEVTT